MKNRLVFDQQNAEYTELQAERIVSLLRSVPVNLGISSGNVEIYPHLCVRGDRFSRGGTTNAARIGYLRLVPVIPAESYFIEGNIEGFRTIREEPQDKVEVEVHREKDSLKLWLVPYSCS